MKKKYLLFLFITIIIGCEQTLNFDGELTESKLTVGALANPDTCLSLYLYKSTFFLDDDLLSDEQFYSVQNAIVWLKTSDSIYYLRYNSNNHQYISDYKPLIGDRIEINASKEGFEIIKGNTQIKSKSDFQIVESITFYNENPKKIMDDGFLHPIDNTGNDTIIKIVCKISDPSNENNYYRLNVRSIGSSKPAPLGYSDFAFANDIFASNDILFFDNSISKSIEGWPKHFSNVFDDRLFDGKSYIFTIESRQRKGLFNWIEIDLQHISYDFYKYLKSIELAKCSTNDIHSEPVKIYSNIENGYGVFGSLTSNKYIIHF